MAEENPRKIAEVVPWLGPILEALPELGGMDTAKQVEEIIARTSGVTEAERTALLKSGQTGVFNQIKWGRQYLVYEGLLVDPQVVSQKRGIWTLTDRANRRSSQLMMQRKS